MNDPILRVIVPESEAGLRLDIFCTHKIEGYSRSFFTKLAASGHIIIDGNIIKASHKVRPGEHVVIEMASPPPMKATPEEIPLKIIFEDDHLLIVDKPAGMVCHPAAGNYTGTLVNALLHHFAQLRGFSDRLRPGLVHRLDKDTSGLLVVAKNEKTLALLQTMLRDRKIERIYAAVVWGKMPQAEGSIDLPLGRARDDRTKMKVYGQGQREALTHYKVSRQFSIAELLQIKLGTGRTHQIRVHLSYFGNPVVGDPTYGGRARAIQKFKGKHRLLGEAILQAINRQALHAAHLNFPHPITGESIRSTSELPDDFKEVISVLEKS